jgi:hypothetical protein
MVVPSVSNYSLSLSRPTSSVLYWSDGMPPDWGRRRPAGRDLPLHLPPPLGGLSHPARARRRRRPQPRPAARTLTAFSPSSSPSSSPPSSPVPPSPTMRLAASVLRASPKLCPCVGVSPLDGKPGRLIPFGRPASGRFAASKLTQLCPASTSCCSSLASASCPPLPSRCGPVSILQIVAPRPARVGHPVPQVLVVARVPGRSVPLGPHARARAPALA